MKNWHKVAIVVGVVVLALLGPSIADNKVGEDEVWWEYYDVGDGSYVRIMHAHDCGTRKPLAAWDVQTDILDYHKDKIDVYDHCIGEDDAIMLNAISKRNIKRALDYGMLFVEDGGDFAGLRRHEEMWDTTDRTDRVYYAMRDGRLVYQGSRTETIILDYRFEKLHVKDE